MLGSWNPKLMVFCLLITTDAMFDASGTYNEIKVAYITRVFHFIINNLNCRLATLLAVSVQYSEGKHHEKSAHVKKNLKYVNNVLLNKSANQRDPMPGIIINIRICLVVVTKQRFDLNSLERLFG